MSSHVVYGHVCVNTHLPGGQRGDWESFFVILFVILLLNLELVGGQQTPVILLSQPQIVLELQSLGSPIPAFLGGGVEIQAQVLVLTHHAISPGHHL